MLPSDTSAREVRASDDMNAIYMMGFDVWRETLDSESYLRACQESTKYRRGSWFVLEAARALVSSMLVYDAGFALPVNTLGFGSIATHPRCRGRGYGSALIRSVLRNPLCRSASAIYLHSDIAPSFYAPFGFVSLCESGSGATCMVRPGEGMPLPGSTTIPEYF